MRVLFIQVRGQNAMGWTMGCSQMNPMGWTKCTLKWRSFEHRHESLKVVIVIMHEEIIDFAGMKTKITELALFQGVVDGFETDFDQVKITCIEGQMRFNIELSWLFLNLTSSKGCGWQRMWTTFYSTLRITSKEQK